MNTLKPRSVYLLAVLGLLAGRLPAGAQADVDPPVIEHIEDTTDIKVVAPTNTMQGTRGLSQTSSAEALGEGRLILGLHGPWYRQERQFQGGPNENADIFTGVGTIAYGISRQWDIFASLTAYGTQNYTGSDGSGLGTVGGGVQGTLPFTPAAPIRMGAQAGVYNGLSDNPIDSNLAHGYSYFETRTGTDFRGSLIQTLVFGSEDAAMKLHFNEGVVTSLEDGVDELLLLNTGFQVNLPVAAVGIELHSRTLLADVNFREDPLWLTPSVQFRTGYNLNISLGGDISLSDDDPTATSQVRPLEPYRLFGGLAFTFDTHAEKRRQEKLEAWRVGQEKARLRARNLELARKAYNDSVDAANASNRITNITVQNQALADKARQDSINLVEKSKRDSLALADAQRRLELERSRRSEMENQLLTTGLLVMDAVYFETGKADISINSRPYLNMLAGMLTKYPKLQIEVAGHTDNVGSDAYNMNLSQARAMAVRNYMVAQVPELSGRLTARGYGESMAKADNTTAEGRLRNRRTELQVTNKDALREYNEPAQATGTPPDAGRPAGTGDPDSINQDSIRGTTPYQPAQPLR
jgi:outer membrane protein OmpA-like peptidoglycan-associated protein